MVLSGLLAQASACVYPDGKRPLRVVRLTLIGKRKEIRTGTNGKGTLYTRSPHDKSA